MIAAKRDVARFIASSLTPSFSHPLSRSMHTVTPFSPLSFSLSIKHTHTHILSFLLLAHYRDCPTHFSVTHRARYTPVVVSLRRSGGRASLEIVPHRGDQPPRPPPSRLPRRPSRHDAPRDPSRVNLLPLSLSFLTRTHARTLPRTSTDRRRIRQDFGRDVERGQDDRGGERGRAWCVTGDSSCRAPLDAVPRRRRRRWRRTITTRAIETENVE